MCCPVMPGNTQNCQKSQHRLAFFGIVTSENDGQGVRKKERGINSRKYWTSFSLHAIL